MDNSNYSKAGDLLGGLMDILGADGGSEIARLFQTWRSIVGDDIASHSAIEDIRNGTVIVVVDHPAWMQQIQFRQEHLLSRMQREFTELEIKRMMCKVGIPKIKPPAQSAEPAAGPAATPEAKPADAPASEPEPESSGSESESVAPPADRGALLGSLERLKHTLEMQEPKQHS